MGNKNKSMKDKLYYSAEIHIGGKTVIYGVKSHNYSDCIQSLYELVSSYGTNNVTKVGIIKKER